MDRTQTNLGGTTGEQKALSEDNGVTKVTRGHSKGMVTTATMGCLKEVTCITLYTSQLVCQEDQGHLNRICPPS